MTQKTPKFATVTLDEPIERGETKITEVQVRRPSAGELRGLNIADLVQMNVDATTKLLPRITVPMLTVADIGALCPSDFTQLGMEVQDFLVPSAKKPDAFPAS
jgi:hypothetical protein